MTTFLRLLSEGDKAESLLAVCARVRAGERDRRHFDVAPELFDVVPGKPFAYWIGLGIRDAFSKFPTFGSGQYSAWVGLQTNDDFQWVRLWWESCLSRDLSLLIPFAKGGSYSKFYSSVYLSVRWGRNGSLIKTWKEQQLRLGLITANNSKCWNEKNYFAPGITWPSRTQSFGPRVLPAGCIFGHKGPTAVCESTGTEPLLARLAIMNSLGFVALVETRLNAADATARSYEVGIIQATPVPDLGPETGERLASLARRAWSLKRTLDTVNETSHAFLLPATLRARVGEYDPPAIEEELERVQAEIDAIAFDLYGFSDVDRAAALGGADSAVGEDAPEPGADEEVDENDAAPVAQIADHLLSWAVGVAFGRFDWRLATGERAMPPEPDPFDPLPTKSPGMLPDGASPFHAHAGILVDDPGQPHDLGTLVEEGLSRVDAPVAPDVRRWLQRDFFPFHLQHYSKSRRKAAIYWPLATASGSYTLWLYYPSLSSETLYSAINDFLDPKLKEVGRDAAALRDKGTARSRDDEKRFDALQTLELELTELRDALLKLAPTYKPNYDDGVQITASPLWPLFRHKPWQKLLKDTWAKLEKGDYDWAHLAMNYWPDRVSEKCKHDKSLAIAHGLEALYVEPEGQPAKTRGRKSQGA